MPPLRDIKRNLEIERADNLNNLRISARAKLAGIDREAPESFSFVVSCLMIAQFDQTQIADCCGFNRTTISRWSQNLNIPRSPVVRSMLIGRMLEMLDESIEQVRGRKKA
jgi:hypothetical protein